MYRPGWEQHHRFLFYYSTTLILHVTNQTDWILKIIRSDKTFRSEWHKNGADRPTYCVLAHLRAARGLLRRTKERLAACWACRPRQQPPVDASDMEAVVAPGEDPDMLPSLKVGEADRAHRVGTIELQSIRVEQDRHGSEGLPPQPALSQPCHRVWLGRIHHHPPRAPQRTPDY
jgi:hypothetical protein